MLDSGDARGDKSRVPGMLDSGEASKRSAFDVRCSPEHSAEYAEHAEGAGKRRPQRESSALLPRLCGVPAELGPMLSLSPPESQAQPSR